MRPYLLRPHLALCDHASVPPAVHRPVGPEPASLPRAQERRVAGATLGSSKACPCGYLVRGHSSLPSCRSSLRPALRVRHEVCAPLTGPFKCSACCALLYLRTLPRFVLTVLSSARLAAHLLYLRPFLPYAGSSQSRSSLPCFLLLSHTRPPRGHDLSCIRSLLPLGRRASGSPPGRPVHQPLRLRRRVLLLGCEALRTSYLASWSRVTGACTQACLR